MDFIPGPRAPKTPHERIPFLCGVQDSTEFPFAFPLTNDEHPVSQGWWYLLNPNLNPTSQNLRMTNPEIAPRIRPDGFINGKSSSFRLQLLLLT